MNIHLLLVNRYLLVIVKTTTRRQSTRPQKAVEMPKSNRKRPSRQQSRTVTPKMTRSERKIARELASHIAQLKRTNKRANYCREIKLLETSDTFQFYGNVIIQSKEDAQLVAKNAIGPETRQKQERAFFVDAACFRGKASGAGVVFLSSGGGEYWEERYYALSKGISSLEAEFIAVAEGLATAVAQLETSPMPKVMIFTDCQDALYRIHRLRKLEFTGKALGDRPVIRKLVTRSQYLHRHGVEIELHWVPGHARVEGNRRAHAAAQEAATTPNLGVSLDEGLLLMESTDT